MKGSKHSVYIVLSTIIFVCVSNTSAFSQGRGTVTGVIVDLQNEEALMFANVGVEGTSLGTTSNHEGRFSFSLPAGKYKLAFSYLSYKTLFREVDVKRDETLDLGNVGLAVESIMGEEAVITALARGQVAAINQQVNANTIVNVVSKDKILELPDQNAAETVARLPGVSLIRDGGEGTMVTLRGMAPRLNLITINNERVPATSDQDRSVDLSMFSTDALAGIEVFKAIRPDMDGDALGGVINFVARKASEGFHGDVKLQTGYNSLKKELGQYQGSFTFENRFFDNKLGAILNGSMQKANRSSEGYTGSWDDMGNKDADGNKVFTVSSLHLADKLEDRKRYSASLNSDYRLKNGELMLSATYGRTDRDELRRRRSYKVASSYQEYDIRKRESTNTVLTTNLSGKLNLFNFLDVNFSGGYSATSNYRPVVERFQFRELGAFEANTEKSYDEIIEAAKNRLDNTWLKTGFLDSYEVDDRNLTAQLNLKAPFRLGNNIDGYVKAGGKYRQLYREYDVNRDWSGSFVGRYIIEDGRENPEWAIHPDNGWILMENFYGDYHADDFMRHFDDSFYLGPGAGEINGPGLDYELLKRDFRQVYYDNYYGVDPTIDLSDYTAGETVGAGYVMTEINFFNRITLLGGVRYEHTRNDYHSIFGTPQVDEDGNIINVSGLVDTVGYKTHEQFLPMFQIRYKAFKWADLRLAATKALSRPNFFNLVPWERVRHFENSVERGNPDLEHMSAWNFDAILSFYGNFGLFTIGGFYKELENIDYTLTSRIVNDTVSTNGYDITMPVNAEKTSTIKGIEIDLQTNFRFLPSPFDGLLVNANYTLIRSETFFPYIRIENLPVFPYTATVIDTFRAGRMPGQVDDVVNLSLGYEKGGFSARISMSYQSSSLKVNEDDPEIGSLQKSVGKDEDLDSFTGSFTRWDLSVKQRFRKNFTIYLNVNNITNTPEISYLAGSTKKLYTRNIVYGMTLDVGLRYKF